METTTTQQVWKHLQNGANILVVLSAHPTTDAIASSLALCAALRKTGKAPTIIAHDFHLPEHHDFLAGYGAIQSKIELASQLIISVDVSQASIEELSYDVQGETLKIFLSPKKGRLTPDNISARGTGLEQSVVVVIDTPDLAALGPVFEENTEFFYSTPIINIDHHSGNTDFGQINIVDLNATSTAEIIFDLLQEHSPSSIDDVVATCLLTGIIAKTKSFQSSVVTPKTLSIAGSLIGSGAKREVIIHALYQSRALGALRLWGRVFARLKNESEGRVIWSKLRREDFTKAGESEQALGGVLEELFSATAGVEIAAVLYETAEGGCKAIVETRPAIDGSQLFQEFHPEHTEKGLILNFSGSTVDQAERAFVEKVRQPHGIPKSS